jgi:hypothetical protein
MVQVRVDVLHDGEIRHALDHAELVSPGTAPVLQVRVADILQVEGADEPRERDICRAITHARPDTTTISGTGPAQECRRKPRTRQQEREEFNDKKNTAWQEHQVWWDALEKEREGMKGQGARV